MASSRAVGEDSDKTRPVLDFRHQRDDSRAGSGLFEYLIARPRAPGREAAATTRFDYAVVLWTADAQ
jgi:hypothetical protein